MPVKQQRKKLTKEEIKAQSKTLKRLFVDLFKTYPLQLFAVTILIIISVFANVQGTMFMQTLIDGYVFPMLKTHSTDFAPLAQAIFKVAVFYAIGVLATFGFTFIMAYVGQGFMRITRNKIFR